MTYEYRNVFITDSIVNRVIISDAFITEDGKFRVNGEIITDNRIKSIEYLKQLRLCPFRSQGRTETITTDDYEKAVKYFNSLSISKREVKSNTELMVSDKGIKFSDEIEYTEFRNLDYKFLLTDIIKEYDFELEISDSVTLKEELLSFTKDECNIRFYIEKAEAIDNRYIVSGKVFLGDYLKPIIDVLQKISSLKFNNSVAEFEDYDFYKLCCVLSSAAGCSYSSIVILEVNDEVSISYELRNTAKKYYKITPII